MESYTILGSTGFIGSRLTRYLEACGLPYWAPQRGDDRIFAVELGHIIYCIGLTADFAQRPLETVEAHVCFLSTLLRRSQFSSLVYLSSTRLYDGIDTVGKESVSLSLNPNNPRNLFDLSKALGEAMCLAIKHPKVVIARLASVYENTLEADNFLHRLIKQALQQSTLHLQTSHSLERDYVHIDDVCAALVYLSGNTRHRIYNVASGTNISNRELFSILERETSCRIDAGTNCASLTCPRIDISRLRDEFDWRPRSPQEQIPAIIFRYRAK